MSKTRIKLAGDTNVGLVRKNNEDNLVFCRDLAVSEWNIPQVDEAIDLGQYGALLVVADGMGGANAGEVASAIAIDTIKAEFKPENIIPIIESDEKILDFMVDAAKVADLNILKKSKEDSSTQGMGTTIVMAWILEQKAYVCWCGDSRCYVFNPNLGLTRLSKDHSYVQELVDKGELKAENAHDHPYSNIITRCLGDFENRAVPDARIHSLHNGDILMLCSDGLCGLCYDDDILNVMSEHRDNIDECKDELIAAAIAAGGHDNVTVVVSAVEIELSEEEKKEADSLTGTLPVKKKSGWCTFIKFLFGALLIVIAVGCYLYFYHRPIYENILSTGNLFVTKIKSLIL